MATARPASPTTTEPSDNECSVCNELFTVPKLLPCGHVLCRHCLVTWLQSQPQAHCPLCRCPVVDPGKAAAASNNYDVVADSFPTDLAMVELVEAERLLSKDNQCCFCDDAKATCLCLDCNDLFCASCKNGHTKQKMSRHHSVQDLTSLTADQLASHRPSPCPAHADKACELYCPSHDTSMCTVCFASQHRSCPDVTNLQQKADESRKVLKQLATRLKQAEKLLNQDLSEVDEHLQDQEKKSKASLAELKAACDRLKSAIDAYYQSVEQEMEEVSKKVNDDKACLSQRRGRVTSERSLMKRVQGMKRHDAIITMTSVMETRHNDLDLSATFSHSIEIVEGKTFTVDKGVERHMLQQLPNLGKFDTQLPPSNTFATQPPQSTSQQSTTQPPQSWVTTQPPETWGTIQPPQSTIQKSTNQRPQPTTPTPQSNDQPPQSTTQQSTAQQSTAQPSQSTTPNPQSTAQLSQSSTFATLPQQSTIQPPQSTAQPQQSTAQQSTAQPQQSTAQQSTAQPQQSTAQQSTAQPQQSTAQQSTAQQSTAQPSQSSTIAFHPSHFGTCDTRHSWWCFHYNHGKNIELTCDSRTAERTGESSEGGIVLGSNPMAVNYLYEIRLVSSSPTGRHWMYVGVVTGECLDDIQLPDTNYNCTWKPTVLIRPSSVLVCGTKTKNNVGAKLLDVPENHTVGLLLDNTRALHFYWNGQDQGVAVSDMPDPCWPMFELYGPYRKVTIVK